MAMTTLDEKSRIAYPERRKILLAVISAIGRFTWCVFP